jgi:hypothetical protein
VDPVLGGIGDVGKEVEDLGELHSVLIVVDKHVANDKDDDAIRLDRQAGLDIAGHDLMLDLGERETLGACTGMRNWQAEGWIRGHE